jgi:hypothetical protein
MLMPPTGAPFGIHHAMEPTGDLLDDLGYLDLTRQAYVRPPEEWARSLGDAGVLFVLSSEPDLEGRTKGQLRLARELGPAEGVAPGSGWVYRNEAFVPRARLTNGGRVEKLVERCGLTAGSGPPPPGRSRSPTRSAISPRGRRASMAAMRLCAGRGERSPPSMSPRGSTSSHCATYREGSWGAPWPRWPRSPWPRG